MKEQDPKPLQVCVTKILNDSQRYLVPPGAKGPLVTVEMVMPLADARRLTLSDWQRVFLEGEKPDGD